MLPYHTCNRKQNLGLFSPYALTHGSLKEAKRKSGRGKRVMVIHGAATTFVRYFSRKCRPNLRRINPKVPLQEASSIANGLHQIIKDRGAITVSNTWNYAKDAGISGLNSKTHLKIMLKWMRGRKMLKLFCTHVGSSKRFLHSTLPEEPRNVQVEDSPPPTLETEKPSPNKKKKSK